MMEKLLTVKSFSVARMKLYDSRTLTSTVSNFAKRVWSTALQRRIVETEREGLALCDAVAESVKLMDAYLLAQKTDPRLDYTTFRIQWEAARHDDSSCDSELPQIHFVAFSETGAIVGGLLLYNIEVLLRTPTLLNINAYPAPAFDTIERTRQVLEYVLRNDLVLKDSSKFDLSSYSFPTDDPLQRWNGRWETELLTPLLSETIERKAGSIRKVTRR